MKYSDIATTPFMRGTSKIKKAFRCYGSFYRNCGKPSLALIAIPRGGSTWVMEILGSLPAVRAVSEPFNLRVPEIAEVFDRWDWSDLERPAFQKKALAYLRACEAGQHRFLNANPLTNRQFFTNRVLFKIIHLPIHIALEVVGQLDGARSVVIIRHPIPVSLSRKEFPYLDSLAKLGAPDYLTADQRTCFEATIKDGSQLECGVLAWCLHFGIFLSQMKKQNFHKLLAYEHLVNEPEVSLERLGAIIDEPISKKHYQRLNRPSRVLSKSDVATQQILRDRSGGQARKEHLVSRWVPLVGDDEKNKVQAILDAFKISYYRADSPFPQEQSNVTF